MIDDRTPARNLALPHPDNLQEDDVLRLRAAFTAIDTDLGTILALLQSDDTTLDVLQELVDSIKANREDIQSIVSGYATDAELAAAVAAEVAARTAAIAAAVAAITLASLGAEKKWSPWVKKTSAYNAVTSDRLSCDTSASGFPVTLPPNPAAGDYVDFDDYAGTWDLSGKNLTIARNGHNINAAAEDMICDVRNDQIRLEYVDALVGWKG